MIEKIKIENFRLFDNIEINNLKRVNFFIGKNNCGKTSILEAILFLTPESQAMMQKSFRYKYHVVPYGTKYLFHNIDMTKDIYLSAQNDKNEKIEYKLLEYKGNLYADLSNPEIDYLRKLSFDATLNYKYDIKNIDSKDKEKYSTMIDGIIVVESANENTKNNLRSTKAPFYIHCKEDDTEVLIAQIDKIKNLLKENILIEYLQFFDKNIQDISLSPNEGIKLRINGVNTLMPLMLMGDGIKKYLTIVAPLIITDSLPCLLIDEIENGLHFETIKHLLRSILRLSKEKNIQMFITTHNYEILKYLSEIMQEDNYENQENDVAIIKVANTKLKGFQTYNYGIDGLIEFIDNETEIRG